MLRLARMGSALGVAFASRPEPLDTETIRLAQRWASTPASLDASELARLLDDVRIRIEGKASQGARTLALDGLGLGFTKTLALVDLAERPSRST